MFKQFVTSKLNDAGIQVGGIGAHIVVHNDRFFRRAAIFGSLGVGDSYADGDFECSDLSEFFERWMRHRQQAGSDRLQRSALWTYADRLPSSLPEWWIKLQTLAINPQSIVLAKRVGERHYDIGNELYRAMLGPTMAYSCGYWSGAKDLDDAQCNKYRIICEKLGLKPGMRVLEIGCGWGGFAAFAAENYGAAVVGASISQEQINFAGSTYRKLCESRAIDLRFMDYRHIPREFPETFDAIVSIGMFEHVGPRNYAKFMRIAWLALKPGGMFLLHTIAGNGGVDPFMQYRIFPGGVLPVVSQIARAAKPYFGVPEHVENFGFDYYRTLTAWWRNFDEHWPEIRGSGRYDRTFYRMWEFYLKSCAAAFKVRRIHLTQWVLSKGGVAGGYQWNRPVYAQ